ncbi:MAG: hypothetical protein F6K21_16570, partial [Symploca sp. SIO2D2]|nr:hypothetical protein [Symploca sp. SIO2D2]
MRIGNLPRFAHHAAQRELGIGKSSTSTVVRNSKFKIQNLPRFAHHATQTKFKKLTLKAFLPSASCPLPPASCLLPPASCLLPWMNSLRKIFLPRLHQVPLRQVLILPFLLQIFAVVGLVGYLSYRSGQQAVTNLANQLMEETGQNVSNRLDAFLEIPKHLVELNRNSLEAGELEINDFDQLEQQFFRQVQAFPSITTMNFANTSGEIVAAGRDRFGLFPIPPDTIVTWDALGDVPNIRRFYQVDERRNRLKVVHTTPEFNAHQRIWYQIAKDANQPNWTPIFPVLNLPIASITMTTPIYVNEEFRGVLSSDVLLEDLNIFLS